MDSTNLTPEQERAFKGFNPVPTQIYLEKQPNLTLFSKPKIIPLKSPNLQMIEKLENGALAQENDIEVPDVFTVK